MAETAREAMESFPLDGQQGVKGERSVRVFPYIVVTKTETVVLIKCGRNLDAALMGEGF